MVQDIRKDAEQCLTASLRCYDITLSDAQKASAIAAVQTQFQALKLERSRYSPVDFTETISFTKTDIEDILGRTTQRPKLSLQEAQRRYGCFLSIQEPNLRETAMPIAVKDIFRFATHHPTAGLAMPPKGLSLPPSPVIARLRRAGADIRATTKLSAWCYLPIAYNELVPPPRHPMDENLMVGGSSSGSAVAVASGAVPVALGSDTGGSIRIPAALCGVYGFKPSQGGIPTRGTVPLGETQDTIGILAHAPEELRNVFEVVTTLPKSQRKHTLRVAIPERAFDNIDAQHQRGRHVFRTRLEQLGHSLSSVPPLDLTRMNATAGLITGFEAARFHGPRIADFGQEYPDTILNRLIVGMAISENLYHAALKERAALIDHYQNHVFAENDAILFPVVSRFGLQKTAIGCPPKPDKIGALSVELLSLNRWVNLLGLPSVSVPIATGHCPAAVQIIGAPQSDHDLLALVHEIGDLAL